MIAIAKAISDNQIEMGTEPIRLHHKSTNVLTNVIAKATMINLAQGAHITTFYNCSQGNL